MMGSSFVEDGDASTTVTELWRHRLLWLLVVAANIVTGSASACTTNADCAVGFFCYQASCYQPSATWVDNYNPEADVSMDNDGGIQLIPSETGGVRILKFNADAVLQWSQNHIAPIEYNSKMIAMNANDDLFVAAQTSGGTVDGQPGIGDPDIALMKFDSNGAWQWTKVRGSSGREWVGAIVIDHLGNIVVSAYASGDIDGQVNQGDRDILVMKFDSVGDWQWSRLRGSSGRDSPGVNDLVCDSSGNIFLAGSTYEGFDGQSHSGGGGMDLVLMKFATDGTWLWTRLRGNGDSNGETTMGRGISLDSSNHIYKAITCKDSFDGQPSAGGVEHVVLLKYDEDGNWQWSKSKVNSGGGQISVYFQAIDKLGNLFITGVVHADPKSIDGQTCPDGATAQNYYLTEFDTNAESWVASVMCLGGGRLLVDPVAEVMWAIGKQSGGVLWLQRIGEPITTTTSTTSTTTTNTTTTSNSTTTTVTTTTITTTTQAVKNCSVEDNCRYCRDGAVVVEDSEDPTLLVYGGGHCVLNSSDVCVDIYIHMPCSGDASACPSDAVTDVEPEYLQPAWYQTCGDQKRNYVMGPHGCKGGVDSIGTCTAQYGITEAQNQS